MDMDDGVAVTIYAMHLPVSFRSMDVGTADRALLPVQKQLDFLAKIC